MINGEVVVRLGAAAREIDIALLDRSSCEVLANMLAAGRGQMAAVVGGDPSPFEMFMKALVVTTRPGVPVSIQPDVATGVVGVAGGLEYLEVLSHNVRSVWELESGNHIHVEYFPGHYYLAPESVATVLHR